MDKNFAPNDYFDLVRDVAGDLAEQVELVQQSQTLGQEVVEEVELCAPDKL